MVFGITVIILLVLLATKELASASESELAQSIASYLIAPIIPVLIIFVVLVALGVANILV